MKNVVIYLQYDGSRYSGWQRQGNTDNTIENKISEIVTRLIYKKESGAPKIEIHGSGRTDAGVHANKQVANFHIDTELSEKEIMAYLNRYLPEDIRVTRLFFADNRFHSRLNAKKKVYRYVIDNGEFCNVFTRKTSFYHPDKLDIDNMKKCAKKFVGVKDFKTFTDLKNNKKSTVREIYDINISKSENLIYIDFTGNGFLYHMVRLLSGTLILAGENKISEADIDKMLERKERTKDMYLALAKGLILLDVEY